MSIQETNNFKKFLVDFLKLNFQLDVNVKKEKTVGNHYIVTDNFSQQKILQVTVNDSGNYLHDSIDFFAIGASNAFILKSISKFSVIDYEFRDSIQSILNEVLQMYPYLEHNPTINFETNDFFSWNKDIDLIKTLPSITDSKLLFNNDIFEIYKDTSYYLENNKLYLIDKLIFKDNGKNLSFHITNNQKISQLLSLKSNLITYFYCLVKKELSILNIDVDIDSLSLDDIFKYIEISKMVKIWIQN